MKVRMGFATNNQVQKINIQLNEWGIPEKSHHGLCAQAWATLLLGSWVGAGFISSAAWAEAGAAASDSSAAAQSATVDAGVSAPPAVSPAPVPAPYVPPDPWPRPIFVPGPDQFMPDRPVPLTR